ncbi:hypothetical protein D3C76_502060 [compost metagenome]
MADADIAAGQQQIVGILCHENAQRNPIGPAVAFDRIFAGLRVTFRRRRLRSRGQQAACAVQVDEPAAVGDFIGEYDAARRIMLRHEITAKHPPAFTFARHLADPVQRIVRSLFFQERVPILNPVPDAQHMAGQFMPDVLIVIYGIPGDADFDPPIPGGKVIEMPPLIIEKSGVLMSDRPIRCLKRDRPPHILRLKMY